MGAGARAVEHVLGAAAARVRIEPAAVPGSCESEGVSEFGIVLRLPSALCLTPAPFVNHIQNSVTYP
jgi:hypothetical protein